MQTFVADVGPSILPSDTEAVTEKPAKPSKVSVAHVVNEIKQALAKYREPSLPASLWQLSSTVVLFLGLTVGAWFLLQVSIWLALLAAIPAAVMIVRLFIIHHDCGHGSFFKSRIANDVVGFILGVVSWTPYHSWRWTHAMHHGSTGDLDHRGWGDIPTLTVKEYFEMAAWKRFFYRLYRHPLVLFGVMPAFVFLLLQRWPFTYPKNIKKVRMSVHLTNLTLLAFTVGMCWLIGVVPFLVICLLPAAIAGTIGVWLFYVQHQFEDAYWERHENWDLFTAAFEGSSHYDLPRVLRWMTANIGLHHIHHLDSRIPNYRLQKCLDSIPELQHAPRLTFWQSLGCMRLKLWDEDRKCMVTFREAHAIAGR